MEDLGEKEASELTTVQGQMELRAKVAELCGWQKPEADDAEAIEKGWWFRNGNFVKPYGSIPDYTSDLNACAEFEKTLDRTCNGSLERYETILADLCGDVYEAICATAEQRCRAFVATMEASK